MKYYFEKPENVLLSVKSDEEGLTEAEAAERLRNNGKNALAEPKKTPLILRFLKQLADPMIIILIAAAVLSGFVSAAQNEGAADVIIIAVVVLFNAVLGVYQESKAEKAIDALKKMSGATSKVIRSGKVITVPSDELVVGDVIILEAGDAVPADARLIESASLKTEESALTGESSDVCKFIDALDMKKESDEVPLADRTNMVYMGSSVTYGRGRAVVVSTGMSTEMGKIANAISRAKEGKTPLQMKLSELSRILTFLVLGICAAIFAVQTARSGLSFESVLDSFMIAVSLAVAAIPEGLVAVVTVVLSIGVGNMSKKNAIVRKLTAVETLGCAQIICSDKTGTLTQNKMTVVDFFGSDEKRCARDMALCSDAVINKEDGKAVGEATEAALVEHAASLGIIKDECECELPRVGEIPFDSKRKMMSSVHRTKNGYIQFTKGAPEVMINRCTMFFDGTDHVPMTEEQKTKIIEANKEMSDRALRVLAVAERYYNEKPCEYESDALENDLCFVGLSAMKDPVRPEVADAIVKCRTAGIRPIMITGDNIDTASAIARELGILENGSTAVTGSELSAMSDEEFEREFRNISVYARVQPEHKTRIVNTWQKAGYITAMTGDGVNDAPSIKAADIGVGMGITGTDVTKNVADIVLTDDNFATIVSAVEEGRRIYDNIRRSIQYLLGSNIAEVISIFIATLCGFVILKPVHLLWINLITDSVPALALGMETAEGDIMKKAPRSARAGVFSGGMGVDIAIEGLSIAALVLSSFFIGSNMGGTEHGMTMAFLTLSLTEIFHSFNMRSQNGSIFRLKTQNKVLLAAAFFALVFTAAVTEIPFLSAAFGFTTVSVMEYLIASAFGILIIPIVEIKKFIKRKVIHP